MKNYSVQSRLKSNTADPQPFAATIVFTNWGKTPAREVSIFAIACPLSSEQPPDFTNDRCQSALIPGCNGESGVTNPEHAWLGGGQESKIMLLNDCLTTGGQIFASAANKIGPTVEDIVSGKVKLWIWGEVDYKDVFGYDHWSKFCGRYFWDWDDFIPAGCNPAGASEAGGNLAAIHSKLPGLSGQNDSDGVLE